MRPRQPFRVPAVLIVLAGMLALSRAAHGQSCTFFVNPPEIASPASETVGVIQVIASDNSCARTAQSNVPWITISFGTPGTGSGTVGYRILANRDPRPRNGAITAAGVTIAVTQAAAVCSFQLSPAELTVPAAGGNASFTINTTCNWTASTTASWLSVSPASGSGTGVVNVTAEANPTTAARTGFIEAGTVALRVNQSAAPCTVTLAPMGASLAASGGTGTIAVSASCAWSATPNVPWISITAGASGNGPGTVSYNVAANGMTQSRTGTIAIAGQLFTITQAEAACRVTLEAASAAHPARASTGNIAIAATAGCRWAASAGAAWITLASSSGDGSGRINYSVSANLTGAQRSATITVAGQPFLVSQAPAAPRFTSEGLVNAATFAAGPVAAGEIVTIFGSEIGPPALATAELNADGRSLSSTLGGARVYFDDTPAPLLYVSETQASAVVPWAVAGRSVTRVEVLWAGVRSPAVVASVTAASPGVFTLAANGSGQAAALLEDFSVNSPGNPVARGSVLQLFATGGGVQDPPASDGALSSELSRTLLPVTAEIGGMPAEVLYAGAAPNLVAGALQINLLVAANAQVGPAVSLRIQIGERQSQNGVTIAVR